MIGPFSAACAVPAVQAVFFCPVCRDEYFADAGRFVLKSQKASIGNLQRMFKIGFNRAARIMDQLAEVGVVGPEEGTKARKILMTPEEFEDYLNNH